MAYPDEVLADSPWLYWRLNEPSGIAAVDSSGNGRYGTYNGGPTLSQAGLITEGTSVLFDASNDFLLSDSAIFNSSTATIEVWFYYDGTPAPAGTLSLIAGCQQGDGTGVGDKLVTIDENGNGAFYVFDGSPQLAIGSTVLDVGIHHFVGVIDDPANTAYIYVDGVLDGTTGATGSFATYVSPNVIVGGDSSAKGSPPTGPDRKAGRRDEFAIYTTALSPARILEHYQSGLGTYTTEVMADSPLVYWRLNEASGAFVDMTGNTAATTLYGNNLYEYQQPPGIPSGFSIYNDVDITADAPRAATATDVDFSDTNIWTLEAWIKTPGTAVGGGLLAIFEMGLNSPQVRVNDNGAGGLVQLVKSFATSDGLSTIAVNDNEWHHIVARRTGGVSTIWIDAVNRSGTMVNPSYGPGNDAPTGFGAHWSGIDTSQPETPFPNSMFIGNLDELAIYDHALSDARIQAHYQAGIAAAETAQVVRHGIGMGRW